MTRYPDFAHFFDVPPTIPRDNLAVDNVFVGCGEVCKERWVTNETDCVYAADPGFADANNGDYTLRSDSRVFADIPGFRPIPFRDFGPRPRRAEARDYVRVVEPTGEVPVEPSSKPIFLFAADEYGEAALRCTRAFRRARQFGIPAEIHLGCDDPAGREREFVRQLETRDDKTGLASPSARLVSEADRASVERVDLWPKDRMPNAQAHQCVPYLEWHLPKNRATTAIQIVYAGGGYKEYNARPEPDPVRRYLNSIGMSVVTLRYRTPRPEGLPKHLTAWQDLQRCIRLVRAGATERGLDPNRIGLMGFSAGGHLTLLGAVSSSLPAYAPIDEIDRLPCNVQWAVAVYPAYALTDGVDAPNAARGVDDSAVLVPEFAFDEQTCPVLFLHGSRDHWASMNSVKCWERLREMHVRAELHTFATRTHCFQYKAAPGTGSANWMDRVRTFLLRQMEFGEGCR